jgi:predicted alpha/beta hydrolase family esterase
MNFRVAEFNEIMKAIIIPGNGSADIMWGWYQSVKNELQQLGLDVIAENMPDPDLARKEYWLPFIKEKLSSEDAILIGHSSGAVAILRYLEENK